MTIHYRIFDVLGPAGVACAQGVATFRHVVGDVIYVGFREYKVQECRTRHVTDANIDHIDLMCINIIELHNLRRDA